MTGRKIVANFRHKALGIRTALLFINYWAMILVVASFIPITREMI